jgi:deoxyribose-phosphate aldolase
LTGHHSGAKISDESPPPNPAGLLSCTHRILTLFLFNQLRTLCSLFCTSLQLISFIFNQLRTLSQNTRGTPLAPSRRECYPLFFNLALPGRFTRSIVMSPENPPRLDIVDRHGHPIAGPSGAIATLSGRALQPNRGTSLNLDWIESVRVNTSAVERRAATLVTRRTVKKDWQIAWLLRAISCMDLTTLSGDDTEERVRRLCSKARRPIQQELVQKLGIADLNIHVGAVCVYHLFVETARHALEGTKINIAAVSTGFPAGLSPFEDRVSEIRRSVGAGAQEIDVVITRAHVFGAQWQKLYDEIVAFKDACGPAHLKVILGTGDLLTLRNVAKASLVAMMAGADFIKTSTGKETVNATLPVGLVMTRMIREYAQETGIAVGFKPAGGIKTAKQSIEWLSLMKEELGNSWLEPHLFRFGASSMLADIERQLEFHATGRYSAEYRHPIA